MKRTLALGGVAAGLLASAAIAAPAHADQIPSVNLANTNFAAQQVAAFWFGEAKANLINATPYAVETQVPTKHVSTGGVSASDKAGVVGSSGDQKAATGTLKNINLPKTTGKVFFIGADHRPHWCSATSVQGQYKNLVATAGHCVYDTKSNATTLDKWVFIPGYYEGKTPWGIYVGKTAYTHYDYSVYEDGDRDYAFVTVYNGVVPTEGGTSGGHYESRVYPTKHDAWKAKRQLEADKTTALSRLEIVEVNALSRRAPEVAVTVAEFQAWNKDKDLTGNGPWARLTSASAPAEVKKDDYKQDKDSYVSEDGKTLFWRVKDGKKDDAKQDDAKLAPTGNQGGGKPGGGNQGGGKPGGGNQGGGKPGDKAPEYKYFSRTFSAKVVHGYQVVGKKLSIGLKDVGTLGSNVGGQGLAYNQKIGTGIFEFGYPSGSHPDGNYAFSGKTLKWAYGKTFKAAAPSMKAEELVGIKSSFTGEGSIGSAWLYRYSNTKRLGYLNGVTIAVSDTDGNNRIDTNVSPYFDGETLAVYKQAAANWSGKIV
ncbi:trypsin-like serine peptidase [Microbispora sp. CA-102843]|uniref:trypsin-like serine peptidase n=1 Tax=Microbispora sp. CA-102843 TaxID=3239952 RepID=UPI003D9393B0